LVLESGAADLRAELLYLHHQLGQLPFTEEQLAAEVRTHLNHQETLRAYKGRSLVLHAVNDQFYDRSNADRVHEWAAGRDKKLVVFAKGDHNTILADNYEEYRGELRAFLDRTGLAVVSPA
jgi:hypothetical protein